MNTKENQPEPVVGEDIESLVRKATDKHGLSGFQQEGYRIALRDIEEAMNDFRAASQTGAEQQEAILRTAGNTHVGRRPGK